MDTPRLGLAHRLWRLLPVRARRTAMVRLTASVAPRPAGRPRVIRGGVLVAGGFGDVSGLGASARIMADALERAGIAVRRLQPGTQAPDIRGTAGWPLVLHVNPPLLPWTLVRLPRAAKQGRYVVGYVAWELPTVPPLWRHALPLLHAIWAPSSFTATALATLPGVLPRIVPIPLAAAPPIPAPLDRAAFGLPDAAVITLVSFDLASSFERKNPLAAIEAHRLAFGDRPDRLLLLKVGHAGHFPGDMRQLLAAIANLSNVRLETRGFPVADSHALTRCADLVLSLHRSEGFGLIPAEAMLLGRPVVATGWSGNMDFMDAASAALVAARLVPAVDPRGVFEAPGAVWADPDPADAASHLRSLADNPDRRATLAQAGQRLARSRLGSGPLEAALAEVMDDGGDP